MPTASASTSSAISLALSSEQKDVIDHINGTWEHCFITGKAGTGKTHVLKWFTSTTRKKVVVCAPTGLAALGANGCTIHNLLGLNTNFQADYPVDMKKINKVRKRMEGVQTIIIDEVSMVSAAMMDAIDRRLRYLNGTSTPFGGVQIVMFGDPYQLPPVVDDFTRSLYVKYGYKSEWFFDAEVWKEVPMRKFQLEQIHRQSDPAFKTILNAVRDGSITANQLKELNAVGARKLPRGATPLLLGSRKKMVEDYNTKKLRALPGTVKEYDAFVNTGFGRQEPADRKLKLKVGAQVLMLNNETTGLWVNGTKATVTGLWPDEITVDIDGISQSVPRFAWVAAGWPAEDYAMAPKYRQVPVRLAWAVTIHKSQGMSIDQVRVDMGTGAFSPGQTYVALSRATSAAGLYFNAPLRMRDIQVDPNVQRFFGT